MLFFLAPLGLGVSIPRAYTVLGLEQTHFLRRAGIAPCIIIYTGGVPLVSFSALALNPFFGVGSSFVIYFLLVGRGRGRSLPALSPLLLWSSLCPVPSVKRVGSYIHAVDLVCIRLFFKYRSYSSFSMLTSD